MENTNIATLQPLIQQFVTEGSRVITDELNAYNGIATLGYTNAFVNIGLVKKWSEIRVGLIAA